MNYLSVPEDSLPETKRSWNALISTFLLCPRNIFTNNSPKAEDDNCKIYGNIRIRIP